MPGFRQYSVVRQPDQPQPCDRFTPQSAGHLKKRNRKAEAGTLTPENGNQTDVGHAMGHRQENGIAAQCQPRKLTTAT